MLCSHACNPLENLGVNEVLHRSNKWLVFLTHIIIVCSTHVYTHWASLGMVQTWGTPKYEYIAIIRVPFPHSPQLCQTQLFRTQRFHIHPSHTQLCHTHTTLSRATLSHTTLSRRISLSLTHISRATLSHTSLSHATLSPTTSHNFVAHNLCPTRLLCTQRLSLSLFGSGGHYWLALAAGSGGDHCHLDFAVWARRENHCATYCSIQVAPASALAVPRPRARRCGRLWAAATNVFMSPCKRAA